MPPGNDPLASATIKKARLPFKQPLLAKNRQRAFSSPGAAPDAGLPDAELSDGRDAAMDNVKQERGSMPAQLLAAVQPVLKPFRPPLLRTKSHLQVPLAAAVPSSPATVPITKHSADSLVCNSVISRTDQAGMRGRFLPPVPLEPKAAPPAAAQAAPLASTAAAEVAPTALAVQAGSPRAKGRTAPLPAWPPAATASVGAGHGLHTCTANVAAIHSPKDSRPSSSASDTASALSAATTAATAAACKAAAPAKAVPVTADSTAVQPTAKMLPIKLPSLLPPAKRRRQLGMSDGGTGASSLNGSNAIAKPTGGAIQPASSTSVVPAVLLDTVQREQQLAECDSSEPSPAVMDIDTEQQHNAQRELNVSVMDTQQQPHAWQQGSNQEVNNQQQQQHCKHAKGPQSWHAVPAENHIEAEVVCGTRCASPAAATTATLTLQLAASSTPWQVHKQEQQDRVLAALEVGRASIAKEAAASPQASVSAAIGCLVEHSMQHNSPQAAAAAMTAPATAMAASQQLDEQPADTGITANRTAVSQPLMAASTKLAADCSKLSSKIIATAAKEPYTAPSSAAAQPSCQKAATADVMTVSMPHTQAVSMPNEKLVPPSARELPTSSQVGFTQGMPTLKDLAGKLPKLKAPDHSANLQQFMPPTKQLSAAQQQLFKQMMPRSLPLATAATQKQQPQQAQPTTTFSALGRASSNCDMAAAGSQKECSFGQAKQVECSLIGLHMLLLGLTGETQLFSELESSGLQDTAGVAQEQLVDVMSFYAGNSCQMTTAGTDETEAVAAGMAQMPASRPTRPNTCERLVQVVPELQKLQGLVGGDEGLGRFDSSLCIDLSVQADFVDYEPQLAALATLVQ